MARIFLKDDSLQLFLDALAAFGEVHGPVLTDDGIPAFARINSAADLNLDYQRTLIPPKKYLLPPHEKILDYSPEQGYHLPPLPNRSIVLFGLHPCDLAGIAYLNTVFTATFPDPLYHQRRDNLLIVGLSCEPDESCFCGEMGLNRLQPFDLFMHRITGGILIAAGSCRGEHILSRFSTHLAEHEIPLPARQACDIERGILDACTRGETFPDSTLWDDFANRCLCCGACSLCCPTCYCFDVQEYGCLDGKTAERLREWDNCLFTDHGMVAGSFNFRKKRRERFSYRYQHKYLGFGPVRGIVACVGCGRCRVVCPVKIDLTDLFREGIDEKPW